MSDIFVVCWFDRHVDPRIEVYDEMTFARAGIEKIMMEYGDRYKWYRSDIPEEAQFGEDGADWRYIYSYPAELFVTAELGDGPHGYVLHRELR